MDTFDKMLLIQNTMEILKTPNMNVNWHKVLATDLLKRDAVLARREEMILPSYNTGEMMASGKSVWHQHICWPGISVCSVPAANNRLSSVASWKITDQGVWLVSDGSLDDTFSFCRPLWKVLLSCFIFLMKTDLTQHGANNLLLLEPSCLITYPSSAFYHCKLESNILSVEAHLKHIISKGKI